MKYYWIASIILFFPMSVAAQWWGNSDFGSSSDPKVSYYGRFGLWIYGMPFKNIVYERTPFANAGLVRDENGFFVATDRDALGSRFSAPYIHEIMAQEMIPEPKKEIPEIPVLVVVPPQKTLDQQVVLHQQVMSQQQVVSQKKEELSQHKPVKPLNFYERMAQQRELSRQKSSKIPPESLGPPSQEYFHSPQQFPLQYSPQQRWMRDSVTENQSPQPFPPMAPSTVPPEFPLESPVTMSPVTTFWIPSRQPTRDVAEQLELALIQNMDILPLSPILVTLENSTATVRGLVATEADRTKAEQILLAHPQIQKVQNELIVDSYPVDSGSKTP